MPEQPPSIMCETCGGWHPTEAHAQYEKEAREKRMAEIKARPDSAYRFDALGFTPEKKEEIEPWMHKVIEKAKDLGDDLQDTDFYTHFGPVEAGELPGALSMLTQSTFNEAHGPFRNERGYIRAHSDYGLQTYLAYYRKGVPVSEKAGWSSTAEGFVPILELQEQWINTRKPDVLKKYQEAISKSLTSYIDYVRDLISRDTGKNEKFIKLAESRIEEAQRILGLLDTVDGRREAMDFIAQRVGTGGTGKRNLIGIIFKIGNALQRETSSKTEKHFDPYPSTRSFTELKYQYRGEEVMAAAPEGFFGEVAQRENNLMVFSSNTPLGQEFYKKFIHALYVPGGSVTVQKDILRRMLEMTRDHPEYRLPIYNFYGKLVWPRPPESKKE